MLHVLMLLFQVIETSASEDAVSVRYTLQMPSQNRTYWTNEQHLRLRYVFTVAGVRCPDEGEFILGFYDSFGLITTVSEKWKKGEEAKLIADLAEGMYTIKTSLQFKKETGALIERQEQPFGDEVHFTVRTTDLRLTGRFTGWKEPVHKSQKDFIYFVLHHEHTDISHLVSSKSDALLLVWGKRRPSEDKMYPTGNTIWQPNATFTSTVNTLFSTMRRDFRHTDYLYFIIVRHADTHLSHSLSPPGKKKRSWRELEKSFLEWEPVLGTVPTHLPSIPPDSPVTSPPPKDAVSLGPLDQMEIVAIHTDALGVLMPLPTRWGGGENGSNISGDNNNNKRSGDIGDHDDCGYCALRMLALLAATLWREHVLQFNMFQAHPNRYYTPPARDNEKTMLQLMGALSNQTQYLSLWENWIGFDKPRGGVPRRKVIATYYVDDSVVNPCHPIFRTNPHFTEFYFHLSGIYNDVRCRIDSDLSLIHMLGLLQNLRTRLQSAERKVDQMQSLLGNVLGQLNIGR